MIFEKIRGIVADQLGIEEENITLETSFIEDLNADSLDLFQVIMELEDEFNVKVEDVEKIKTVGDAVKFVESVTK
ncbi:acyl carrier protein [Clostridium sp. NSJ-6]|uniref:Acyl carrier protein n=1 Tax=Clostridium hominis TaxID=2763036 RepID=A0ABR7DAU6_9CLOT|nr:acyl carrier protein [Clostridium hominis]MBC5628506.1 acyl carrier protein [Clostridium hominis]MDU2671026.1 acyl carrier protein [Clostridium sp.]